MAEAVRLRALVFDAYGTLFDVHSISEACEAQFPGKGAELSRLWRAKQLEYTWLRSLMGCYRDFEAITGDALAFSSRSLGLALTEANAATLLGHYRRLDLFPEVKNALAALSSFKKAILSNGSPAMLNALVENAGIRRHLDAVISVDALKIFKPHPSVYELAPRHLGVAADEIGFVSSNFWDISGATSFGFRTFWINRGNAPEDELGFHPHRTISGLDELSQHLPERRAAAT